VAKGAEREDCHPAVWRLILQAARLRRFPPSYEWLRAQPAGWVREVAAAVVALERREAWEIKNRQPGG